jgi:hypothetical protein
MSMRLSLGAEPAFLALASAEKHNQILQFVSRYVPPLFHRFYEFLLVVVFQQMGQANFGISLASSLFAIYIASFGTAWFLRHEPPHVGRR